MAASADLAYGESIALGGHFGGGSAPPGAGAWAAGGVVAGAACAAAVPGRTARAFDDVSCADIVVVDASPHKQMKASIAAQGAIDLRIINLGIPILDTN